MAGRQNFSSDGGVPVAGKVLLQAGLGRAASRHEGGDSPRSVYAARMPDPAFHGHVARCLREDASEVLNAWMDTLRTDPVCQPVALVDELAVRSVPVLEELAHGFDGPALDLSQQAFRGAVREFSFVGGWLAGREATASLAVKWVAALGTVLRARLPFDAAAVEGWRRLEQELVALTMETFCRSLRSEARQRRQELLERATPVLRLPGDVPALLVLGAPDRDVLAGLCGRLLLEVARLGASQLILDFAGCTDLPVASLSVLVELLDHRKLAAREVILSGAEPALERHLRSAVADPSQLIFVSSWDAAVAALS